MAKIAVVEDTPIVRRAICRALRSVGHTVDAFTAYHPALKSLSQSAPDLLVADVMLPDGSGLDLVARLRDVHHEFFPVIITSALATAADFKRGFVAGADDYIRKPFPASELVAKCERHLSRAADSDTQAIELALPGGQQSAFSRYSIAKVAGRGNNGIVYHATDLKTDREVALKVLNVMRGAQDARLRFLREIYALSAVDSPHVVRVSDYGVSEGRFYYAMDPIHGVTVAEKVEQDGVLDPASLLDFLGGLAHALDALHRAKILHRDLSPTNVVLRDGDWAQPVLLDFGLAKREFDHALTQDELLMGTPGYLDPLILLGTPATALGDLFSLGAVARFGLVGAHPFPERNGLALINHMLLNRVSIPLELPPPERVLLQSLTELIPNLRPESAGKVLATIEEIRIGS